MRVFISSTSEDLSLHRKAAGEVVSDLGWQPDMMESFGTEGHFSVLEACSRRVERCDVVLAILGWSLGSVPGPERGGDGVRSHTAWELESARSAGKPVLVLMARLESWPEDRQEKDAESQRRVEEFRASLDRLAVFFDWEPEPLPAFRAKVKQELLRYQQSLLAQDVRVSWGALRDRWTAGEETVRDSVRELELQGRPDLPLSQVESLWQEWIAKAAWHTEIRKSVNQLCDLEPPGPLGERMIRQLEAIDFGASYTVLCNRIQTLMTEEVGGEIQQSIRELESATRGESQRLNKLRSFRLHFHQLREQVTTPRFRRCLLLCGSAGAGKTHRTIHFEPDPFRPVGIEAEEVQFSSALGGLAAPAPWRCLILRLEQQPAAKPLEQEIVDALGPLTGRSWPSLEEFDRSLAGLAGQAEGGPGAPRLAIVLDDLHRWIRARPGFVEELTRLMNRTTRLHSLYWVISIQEIAYDKVSGEALEEFWRRMSVTPDPRPRDLRRSRPGEIELWGPDELVGSWLNLDELNRRQSLGLKLIAREVPGFSPEERSRELDNPQIAWILLDCRDRLSPERAVNLHFIAFIEGFWRKRWQQMASLQTGRALKEAEMEQVVSLIAHAIAEQAELTPEKGAVIEAAVAAGRAILKRDVRDQLEAGFPLLEAAGLLKTESVRGGRLGAEVRLSLRTLFFWYFHLARQLYFEMDGLPGPELRVKLAELPSRFATFAEEDREGTLEFLLLLAADYLSEHRTRRLANTMALWRSAVESPDLPQAAVWLAAAKGNAWAQEAAAGFARERRVRVGERRPLFAFLYFVSEVELLPSFERTAFLRPLFPAIQQWDLQGYFLFVFRRILEAVDSKDEWLAVAARLPGCEVLGKTEILGRMMVEKAASLVDDVTVDLLNLIVRFLRTEDPESRGDPFFDPWQRFFVREWMLFAAFDLIVSWKQDEKSRPAIFFEELAEFGWYDPKGLKLGQRVGREMEQEANIAIGRRYRNWSTPKDRAEFEALINAMVANGDARDRQLAFFLIWHTGVPDQQKVKVFPPVFREPLRQICQDPRLGWLLEQEKFQKEIRLNLPGFFDRDAAPYKPTRDRRRTNRRRGMR